MTWTVDSTNTTTLTGGGTEDVLVAGATANATYVFKADLSNMANGDLVECKIYSKVLTGSSLKLIWKGSWSNIPVVPVIESPFIGSDFSLKVSLTQQLGTGRSVDWSLLRQ